MGSTDRKNKGQGLVEFMLVALILLTLLVGIAEFSRFFMTRNILTGAAREAVRSYAADPAIGGWFRSAEYRGQSSCVSAGINGAPPVDLVDLVPIDMVTGTVVVHFPCGGPGFLPRPWDATIRLAAPPRCGKNTLRTPPLQVQERPIG